MKWFVTVMLIGFFGVAFGATLVFVEPSVATVVQNQQKDRNETKGGAKRINADDDSVFGKDASRIDFDKTPDGKPLKHGDNISKTFIPLGCTFATSIDDSYVGTARYDVGGKSGNLCAATMDPLYQGVMTIRFCKPGDAATPAGVTKIGIWISLVAPEGTALKAFDAKGNRIIKIETTKHGTEFLGLISDVPIASVQIIPDLNVDPDFAIDDLVFDTPVPLTK